MEHVRAALELKLDIEPVHDSERTLWRHREFVRARLGVAYDPARARELAEAAIRAAAATKDNPADLINVALEELVRARLELPAYRTLDEMAGRIRTEVNTAVYVGIAARLDAAAAAALDGLLVVDPGSRRSGFDRCKTTARAVTVTRFREHVAYLMWARYS